MEAESAIIKTGGKPHGAAFDSILFFGSMIETARLLDAIQTLIQIFQYPILRIDD